MLHRKRFNNKLSHTPLLTPVSRMPYIIHRRKHKHIRPETELKIKPGTDGSQGHALGHSGGQIHYQLIIHDQNNITTTSIYFISALSIRYFLFIMPL